MTLVGTTPFAIVVAASSPVKSIAEWIAYAKARPGQLLFGSGGNWGSSHLCMESLNALTGLKLTHVPYANTASAFNDIIGGNIHTHCPTVPGLAPYTQSGRIRALGVTYRTPTKLLPGLPRYNTEAILAFACIKRSTRICRNACSKRMRQESVAFW